MPRNKVLSEEYFTAHKKKKLLTLFLEAYGEPSTELEYNTPFQLLIAVMLSAQSTDKKVNEVTKVLFKKYKSVHALSEAKFEDVKQIIREVNYHITKAKHVIETARLLLDVHKGKVPQTHDELIALPGVGNKTANVILSELGYGYALPVDTHVFRVSKRLGLAKSENRDEVEKELCQLFKKETWHDLHHWLIFHGRRVCHARTPECDACCVRALCHFYNNKK